MESNGKFNHLSPEQKQHLVEKNLEFFQSAVVLRMQILPVVATLAAALLIIASFNNQFIPLNNAVKIFLSIFLIIIPISLWIYNHECEEAQIKIQNQIEGLIGKVERDQPSFISRISNAFPNLVISIIGIIIFFLLLIIWQVNSIVFP